MAFKINKNDKSLTADVTGDSKYINESGVYDVTINFASYSVASTGTIGFNLNVMYGEEPQTFYGPYFQKADGTPISVGTRLLTQLGVIAGVDEFGEETEEHAVGKDNKLQEFTVIPELADLPIKIHVLKEYYRNSKTNEIGERMVIQSFFREDGASAEEIVNDSEVGKRLATVKEKYADKIRYSDNLTPEDIETYKAARAAARAGGKAAPVPTATKARTGSLFAKK